MSRSCLSGWLLMSCVWLAVAATGGTTGCSSDDSGYLGPPIDPIGNAPDAPRTMQGRADAAPADAAPADAPADAPVAPADVADGGAVVVDAEMDGGAMDSTSAPDALLAGLGTVCTMGGQCATGFCVDGICCNEACGETCRSCLAGRTGGADGTCAMVKDGLECRGSTDSCRNGQLSEKVCKAGQCTDSRTPCQSAVCASETQCKPAGACKVSNDCQGGSKFFCDNGTCAQKRANGSVCKAGDECTSGNCVQGICCDKSCGGPCQTCTAASKGVCKLVPANTECGTGCLALGAVRSIHKKVCTAAGACIVSLSAPNKVADCPVPQDPCSQSGCEEANNQATCKVAASCANNAAGACCCPSPQPPGYVCKRPVQNVCACN
jgi:hypothetical protein